MHDERTTDARRGRVHAMEEEHGENENKSERQETLSRWRKRGHIELTGL